ncbi:MAG TPA: O-antigen ligase family protein [Solirubrobacteraceae bacterium]|nr:O-antigen ligase family protein [Solirubrobacteraceae bacterium]
MLDRRVSGVALLLLPAGLTAYLAFNAGGYFPTASAFVAGVLAVVLALRVTGSTSPFEGWRAWSLVGGGALGLYALLTLASASWSHAPGLALLAFVLALVYALTMALFGAVGHTRARLVWMLRVLAGAIFVVCGIALISRVLPHLWPTSPSLANNRLSFPLTYWNALGLLAAYGILLCANFASRASEPLISRAAGAAALPVLASTLYFTFSRGSIGVCMIGLIAYGLIARPRGLPSALLSAGVATAITLKVDYDASLLATLNPTTPAAVHQGHHVAVVIIACAIGAGLLRAVLGIILDRPLRRIRLEPKVAKRVSRTGWSVLAAAVVIAMAVLNGRISHEYHQFFKPPSASGQVDLRNRLTDPSNDGRVELWTVALHQFEAKPLLGQGAGTFQNAFLAHRTTTQFVVNAHSLYLETLDELGIVGLVLLLVAIFSMLIATALRARGPDRPLYAVVFALILAWAIEAGIDWDWQMPAVTLLVFALGGFMLARDRPLALEDEAVEDPAARPRFLSTPFRTAAGIVCLLLAVAPAYVWLSQRKLNQADLAFANSNYRAATDLALSSASILGIRPEAYELIAYSDLHRDMPELAIRAMRKAVSLDRNNWNYAYGLALMEAAGGLNPLAEARRALTLNPKEPLVQGEWETFNRSPPSKWPEDAKTIADAFASL